MTRILRYFPVFVILSLLLHLGAMIYFGSKTSPPRAPVEQPFYVDLREPPTKPRELDLPEKPSLPRPTPAKRLGPSDQVVPHETAPKGEDVRDATPRQAATPPATPSPAIPQPPTPTPVPKPSPQGTLPSARLPSVSDLLASSKRAAQTVASLDPTLQRKLREEIDQGAVWLDTEKDILGSFYRRFRDSIEEVWIYPQSAAESGQSGVCLYKIVINRAGVLVSPPQLLNSSGYPLLDEAAGQAIKDAAPRFGFLPSAYPEEALTIFAFFEYRLGGRPVIYGERLYR